MLRKIGALILIVAMMCVNCSVFAGIDTVYRSEFSENFKDTLIWNNLSEIGIASPNNCSFTVNISYDTNVEKEYVLYMKMENEPERQIVSAKLSPYKTEDKITYRFPEMKYGNHRFTLRRELDGETIGEWNETLSVVKVYEPQFMDQFSICGVNTHVARDANWAIKGIPELIKSAGIKKVRGGISWYNIENKGIPGIYQKKAIQEHEKIDYSRQILNQGGYNLFCMAGIPENRYSPEDPTYGSCPTTPENIEGFSEFYANVLKWNPGLVETAEFLNEPNKKTYPAAKYTNLVMKGSLAFDRVQYDGNVEAFSLYPFRQKEWAGECFASGIYPYITSCSVHPYGFGSGPTFSDIDATNPMINWLYDNILDYGGWKDIDINEFGSPNMGGTSCTEYQAAMGIVKEMVKFDKYNVIGAYIYALINDGTNPTDRESNFGIVRHIDEGRQLKDQYIAVSAFNNVMNGALQLGQLDFGELNGEIRGYVYLKDNEPVMIVWDSNVKDEMNRTLDLAGETFTVTDMYGNDMGEFRDSIELTEEPWFIRGLSREWINRAVRNEINSRINIWMNNYGDTLTDNVNAQQVFDEIAETLKGDIDADDAGNMLDKLTELGLKIIAEGKDGKYSDVEVSKRLFQIYESMIYIDRLYASLYNGKTASVSESDVASAEKKADTRYKNRQYMMQYSNEILRHAKRWHDKAVTVAELKESNPEKYGIVKAWDMLSADLLKWFDAFSEYEHAYNHGLISHMFVDADHYMETAYDGEQKKIRAKVINEGKSTFIGTLRVYDEDDELVYETKQLSVGAGKQYDAELELLVRKLEDIDTRTYRIDFVDKDGYVEATRKHIIEVSNMLTSSIADCEEVPSELKTVKLNIENLFDVENDLTIKLSSSDNIVLGTDTIKVPLAGMEKKTVEIPVNEVKNTKFHHYTVKYEIYNGNGTKIVEENVPLSFIPITKASKPIDPATWDGDESDWYDAYPIYREYAEDPNDPESYKNSNMAIRIMKKWDAEHLYVLVDAFDDSLSVMYSGEQLWNGDCVQISVDPLKNGSDLTKAGSDQYNDDDYEAGFALTGIGSEFYQWRGASPNEMGAVDWVKIIRDPDTKCTKYLIALPADKFGLKMSEGQTIKFNVAVNEGDALGREFFYQITNGTADAKNPSAYYEFELIRPTDKEYVSSSTENAFPK